MRFLSRLLCCLAATCAWSANAAPFLYAWASHEDSKQGDFLAVFEANPKSADYGKLLRTVPTGSEAGVAHHIEYEMPGGSTLFANDWGSGESFIFNIHDRAKPVLAAHFQRAGDFIFPHSFARLPNGDVLATFQAIGETYAPPGGLVELDNKGQLVRSASTETPDIPTAVNWPYSLLVIPAADRVVTTSTDMGRGKDWKSPETRHVQIWSMKELKLLASVPLPQAPAPYDKAHTYPAEPRLLADGSVYVNTFSCGLYRINGLTSGKPSATFVYGFPRWRRALHVRCPCRLRKVLDPDGRLHQRPDRARRQRSRQSKGSFAPVLTDGFSHAARFAHPTSASRNAQGDVPQGPQGR